jgi:pimeloyl-ACP methyl ester carboxylesterase
MDINGHTCHYETAGEESAPAVVFLHGTFLNSAMWEKQVEALRGDYRVITYDMRGYGQSSCPPRFERYEWVEDLRWLLDYLEVGRAVICGTTMGGPIALQFALDNPERVRGLVLAACGPGPKDAVPPLPEEFYELRKEFINILETDGVEAAVEAQDYFKSLSHPAMCGIDPTIPDRVREIVADNDAASYANLMRAGMHFNLMDYRMSTRQRVNRLHEIACAALVVVGEHDIQFREHSHFMAEAIPGAVFHVLPGEGALLTLSGPDPFNKMLSAFCKAVIDAERGNGDKPSEAAQLELEVD